MHETFTSKLFFGKYPYKLAISREGIMSDSSWLIGWTPEQCVKWLKSQDIDYRAYTEIRFKSRNRKEAIVKSSIFVTSEKDFDLVFNQYSKNVVAITKPYKAEHVDVLKDNINIIIRPILIYKKYRYVITFQRRYLQTIDDIDEWVINNGFHKDNRKWHKYGYNPRLYLANEEDFVMTKLTWADRIRQITIVKLLDEQ